MTNPTVNSITMSDMTLGINQISKVTIIFSEAVKRFSNNDVTAQNGTLSELDSHDGGVTWEAFFKPNKNIESTVNVISIGSNYTDLAGNPGTSATGPNYTIDTIAPKIVSIAMSDTDLNIGSTSTVTVTFSEAVTGFANNDVTAENGTLTNFITSDNIIWTSIFTPNADVEDSKNVIKVGSNYTDLAGNKGSSSTSDHYAIDTIAPFVKCVTMSEHYITLDNPSTLTIYFSEPVIGFSNSDVTVEHGTLSTLFDYDNEGKTWESIFKANPGVDHLEGSITISSAYTDLAGNPGCSLTVSDYIVDTV